MGIPLANASEWKDAGAEAEAEAVAEAEADVEEEDEENFALFSKGSCSCSSFM